jgi:predicted N-acetyltransferase YhbS
VTITYRLDAHPAPALLADLRESVGWDRAEADWPKAYTRYDTTVAAYDGEQLVGWAALLSDAAQHAFLIDVIVHPAWQRRGIGREVVRRGVGVVVAKGVRIVHVDFGKELTPFYEGCGFELGTAGIYWADRVAAHGSG